MSYLDKRFPDGIASDPVGGPGFKTEVASTVSGFERRDEGWPESLHSFEFSPGVKSSSQLRDVVPTHTWLFWSEPPTRRKSSNPKS